MGPHPKPLRRFESAHRIKPLRAGRSAQATTLKALKLAAKKKREKEKLQAEMAKTKPKAKFVHKGTHYHEPEGPSNLNLSAEARWISEHSLGEKS